MRAGCTGAAAAGCSPGDVKLYTLYSQFVKSEADSVVPRGVTLFPRSAELLAMNAHELRSKGQLSDALSASRQALAVDSTLDRGELMIAQGEIELGRADSALAALHRAIGRGEDTALVAQSAFLVGVAAYSITQSALADAPKMTEKTQSCELSYLGAETLPLARAGLEAGQEVSPEAAKQFLDYLGQLEPYVQRQIDAFCPKS
ncbi:MAG TPA: hypothetical protein VGJ18_07385 [Gemmatimonadaceae bacterium]